MLKVLLNWKGLGSLFTLNNTILDHSIIHGVIRKQPTAGLDVNKLIHRVVLLTKASFMQKPLKKPSICTLSMRRPQPLQDTITKLSIIRKSTSPYVLTSLPIVERVNPVLYMQPHKNKKKLQRTPRDNSSSKAASHCLASYFDNYLNILAKAVLKIYPCYFFPGLRLFTSCILYPLKEKRRTNRSCRVLEDKALIFIECTLSQFSFG